MFSDIIKAMNWLDICLLILLLRICYIAVKNGFPEEVFKIFGTAAAVYFPMQYYSEWSAIIRARIGLQDNSLRSLDFFVFISLVILLAVVFALLRKLFARLMKIETLLTLNRWGGFILGLARSVLVASLLIFMLLLSGIGFLNNGVRESYSGKYIAGVAPAVYSWLWHGLFSKLFTGEKFNDNVLQVWPVDSA